MQVLGQSSRNVHAPLNTSCWICLSSLHTSLSFLMHPCISALACLFTVTFTCTPTTGTSTQSPYSLLYALPGTNPSLLLPLPGPHYVRFHFCRSRSTYLPAGSELSILKEWMLQYKANGRVKSNLQFTLCNTKECQERRDSKSGSHSSAHLEATLSLNYRGYGHIRTQI